MRLFIITLLALLWALPASALDDATEGWTQCDRTLSGKPATQPQTVTPGKTVCWEWNNSGVDSGVFLIKGNAEFRYNADRDDATKPPAGGGTIIPRACPDGVTPSTTECSAVLPSGCANLDGTDGDASLQCWQVNVGPGRYYFEVDTAIPSGDEAIVYVQGADNL